MELSRGDKAAARVAFEAALKKDPAYFPAAASLANMDSEVGKYAEAEKYFASIVKADPKNLKARISIINLKSQQGESKDKLAEELTQLVKDVPLAVAPRVATGAIAHCQERWPKGTFSSSGECGFVA